ncbi:MAG: response regulator transcription factor [Verrucomicrobiota bacterium]
MSDLHSPCRILLVDDHLIVRRGLASLIDDEPDLEVVAEAGTGAEALQKYSETEPDVTILDLRLPDDTGVNVAAKLRDLQPDAKLMILSSFLLEEDVHRAYRAGILGYVAKDASSADLLHVVRSVASGRQVVTPEVSLLLARSAGNEHLSPRELEILKLIAQGRANKEIGDLLSVAENTVKNHVKSILSKLGARDRTHAVSEGLRRGLFRLSYPGDS